MGLRFRKDIDNVDETRFIEYDSFDEALEEMGLASKQADLGTLQWQWDLLTSGTYAMRFVRDIVIYTEITGTYNGRGMEGYVFGKHYSIATHGSYDLGDAHRSTFHTMITKEMFEAAEANRWAPLRRFSNQDFLLELDKPFYALTACDEIPTISLIDYVDSETKGMKGMHFNSYNPDGYEMGIPMFAVLAIIPKEMAMAAKAEEWDILPRYVG